MMYPSPASPQYYQSQYSLNPPNPTSSQRHFSPSLNQIQCPSALNNPPPVIIRYQPQINLPSDSNLITPRYSPSSFYPQTFPSFPSPSINSHSYYTEQKSEYLPPPPINPSYQGALSNSHHSPQFNNYYYQQTIPQLHPQLQQAQTLNLQSRSEFCSDWQINHFPPPLSSHSTMLLSNYQTPILPNIHQPLTPSLPQDPTLPSISSSSSPSVYSVPQAQVINYQSNSHPDPTLHMYPSISRSQDRSAIFYSPPPPPPPPYYYSSPPKNEPFPLSVEAEEKLNVALMKKKREEERKLIQQQREEQLKKLIGPSKLKDINYNNVLKGLSLDSKPPSKIKTTAIQNNSNSSSSLPHPNTSNAGVNDLVTLSQYPGVEFVRHLVLPMDDLVDLALRYDTSVEAIRRYNRRVVFDYLDNVMNEIILIPIGPQYAKYEGSKAQERAHLNDKNPSAIPILTPPDGKELSVDYVVPGCGGLTAFELARQSLANKQFSSVRSFLLAANRIEMGRNSKEECSEAEARFYCDEHNWNSQLALKAYREDLEWERQEEIKKVERKSEIEREKRANRSAAANKYSSLLAAVAQAKQSRLAAISLNKEEKEEQVLERMRRRAEAKRLTLEAQKNANTKSALENSLAEMKDRTAEELAERLLAIKV